MDTYFISDKCVGCGGCHSRCPVNCIDAGKKPLLIDQSRCIGCGACYLACPLRAIEKR
ncbi:MAG: 4Fe-4S binding protein [Clostridiales bacterium]|nr:4Fe-4S binding protein [Clostridiales bacterium]MDY4144333.1 4Fe-4S binding protein [Oscillospiraceae bacterium]